MNAMNDGKINFWSKVRSSQQKLTSSLGNLSLKTEHDGDSPESTLVHKAIVKHFKETNQRFPEWLGVVEEPQRQQHYQNQQAEIVQQQAIQRHDRHQRSQLQPQDQSPPILRRAAPSASFKDIYTQKQQQQQQPSQYIAHVPLLSQQQQQQQQQQQEHQQQEVPRNNMRDRMKRNNTRTRFV